MAEVLTNLGSALSVTPPEEAKLDTYIKNILAYKPILARIFKESVSECKNMSYNEIEACIEGDATISEVMLTPGESNPGKIDGNTQESAVPGEGKIAYDIRTVLRIRTANNNLRIKILLDLEAQKDDTPGYDISERAIFYGCRMISSQLGTEFTNSPTDKKKYGNIKKVYSIWICTETPQKRANTIVSYKFEPGIFPKEKPIPKSRYDLMEIIIINISKEHNDDGSPSELIRMLTDLFNEKISSKEKIELLKERYDLPTTEHFEKEVSSMTAYAASLINKGLDEGQKQGKRLGIKQGREESRN